MIATYFSISVYGICRFVAYAIRFAENSGDFRAAPGVTRRSVLRKARYSP